VIAREEIRQQLWTITGMSQNLYKHLGFVSIIGYGDVDWRCRCG